MLQNTPSYENLLCDRKQFVICHLLFVVCEYLSCLSQLSQRPSLRASQHPRVYFQRRSDRCPLIRACCMSVKAMADKGFNPF
ncbi:MAG: hypothetical protein F6K14_04375 [Symploca sp. SIO2C1]|nr:hypothetical protein [Symploca sp. SIO2C1]